KPSNAYLDVETWRSRLGEIEGQVCRIEVKTNRGTVFGTGCLVGPDVVITNYHVMDAVVAGDEGKANRQGLSGKRQDVVVRFDFKRLTNGTVFQGTPLGLAATWLLDHSPPSEVDFEVDPKARDPDPEELDYALIRLDSDPGNHPIGSKADPASPRR